jgi:2-polyprenyl-3-methyl-5-hydroxy-6-metoxy-1,4-benzoquinol methylase
VVRMMHSMVLRRVVLMNRAMGPSGQSLAQGRMLAIVGCGGGVVCELIEVLAWRMETVG